MKRMLVMGIAVVMLLSVFAGMAAAQTKADNQWGFKADVDLGDEFEAYMKVGYDTMIMEINQGFAGLNGSYEITDHDCSLEGDMKSAGAISQDGNSYQYEMGNYIDAKADFTASGTFPNSNTVEDMMNESYSPKKMDSELNIVFKHKVLVDGTAVTDGNGNVTSLKSDLTYEMSMRVKGKNVPIPIFLYAMLESKAVDYKWVDMDVNFDFLNATDNSICFQANVYNWGDEYVGFKVSGFSIDFPGATVEIKDLNGNGYLDDGEILCIEGNVSAIIDALSNGEDISITYTDSAHGVSDTASLNYWWGDFNLGSLYVSYSYKVVEPEFSKLVNESKELPPYDDFDFTITVTYKQSTTTTYSPALPLLPTESMEINATTTGTYSGEINIVGLQEKYMKIVETLLNTTFPVTIEKIDTGNDEFNHGTINTHETMWVSSSWVVGTKEYGGETVYVVAFTGSGYETFGMPSRATPTGSAYYYYSPSKKFIVGGGVNLGVTEINTEATTYQEASDEVNDIKSEDVSTGLLTTMGFISILIILAVLAVVAAIIVVHHKKSVAKKMQENQ